jgi:hypothetical protein
LIFIIEAVLVTAGSWILSRRYFGMRLFSDAILVAFTLFFAQIVLVGLFLGSLNLFYLNNVLLMHSLIFLLVFLSFRYKNSALSLKPDLGFFFKSNLLILAFSFFSAFFLVKGCINLINPPVNVDSLTNHLAFPAFWIKNGNLNNPVFIFGSSPVINPATLETSMLSYYPINAELFFSWLMMPLRNAFLADAGEAPFYIIGIIAVYSILRKFNVEKRIALLSGFLWALIPNIFKQLRSGSLIDVICAVLLLMVLNSLLLLKRDFTFKNACLFGISTGLLIGTKMINLVWLAGLVPLASYVFYEEVRANRTNLLRFLGIIAVLIFMLVLFGGYMYIKNFAYTGNPVFPIDLKIFGKTVFKGLMDSVAYKAQIAAGESFDLRKILFEEGLGVQFLALILPGTFLPVFFLKYLKNKLPSFVEAFFVFLTPIIMLLLYFQFVNVPITRFFFPYLGIGLITAVILAVNLTYGDKYLHFIFFVSIIASASELAHRGELVFSFIFSLVLFAVLVVYKKRLFAFYTGGNSKRLILPSVLLISLSLFFLNAKYDREEFDRYCISTSKKEPNLDMGRSFRWFNTETGKGARVAYTGRPDFYPLYGSGLKNRVTYVSVNAKEVTPYNKPDGLFRKARDFYAWRNNLKKEGIEYLFVMLSSAENREHKDTLRFAIEDEWAAAHPEDFKLVFSNSLAHIYKISPFN